MVTHEQDTAEAVSNRVIRLGDGRIAENSGRREAG
jgi:ABC-type sulfate/molybdate transport systems ATPase subunit